MKTRVAKIVAEEKIEIFEEEVPVLKDGQVLVKLKAVGICGSDLHFFRHCGLGSFKNPLPIDIGHEPAGEVVESKHESFKAGQHVAIEPGLVCYNCDFCTKHKYNLCKNVKFLGANDIGAFRDYIILEPERLMLVLNQQMMPHEKAALLEPLGVALHAVDRIHILGSEVAILGAGTIGLCLLSVLKKSGCDVTVFEPLEYRRAMAEKFGAKAFDIDKTNEFKNSFETVFDAAGMQDSFTKMMNVVGAGGEVCVVGIPEIDMFSINPHQMRIKEVSLHNSRRSNDKLHTAYNEYLLNTTVENMITHRMPLEDIQKGFEIASKYQDGAIKVMITG